MSTTSLHSLCRRRRCRRRYRRRRRRRRQRCYCRRTNFQFY